MWIGPGGCAAGSVAGEAALIVGAKPQWNLTAYSPHTFVNAEKSDFGTPSNVLKAATRNCWLPKSENGPGRASDGGIPPLVSTDLASTTGRVLVGKGRAESAWEKGAPVLNRIMP